ncbi:DUF3037 domain-containing protein [bacterium]|nr:DUF3037 domain-containing protein [bacterium]
MENDCFYSVLQFCPDRARQESVNVGVVILCPAQKFLGLKTSESVDRLRLLFSHIDFDEKFFQLQLNTMENRIRSMRDDEKTKADFEHFIDSRAQDLVFTKLRRLFTETPVSEVDKLFEELVLVPAKLP